MIKSLSSLLRRIVGRIKNNMSTIHITVAMGLMAIGLASFMWGAAIYNVVIMISAFIK